MPGVILVACPPAGIGGNNQIPHAYARRSGSVSLKVLYRALLRLCGFAGLERAQIAAPACLCVFLARVQAILAGFQLSNHKHASKKAVWAFHPRWGNVALGRRCPYACLTRPANLGIHSSQLTF